jgi:SAM-dependent methyltransferase
VRGSQSRLSEQSFHDEFYNTTSDEFLLKPIFAQLRRRMVAEFAAAANLHSGSEVLSIGCGSGISEALLAPKVRRIVGVDLSPTAIAKARSVCSKFPNASFAVLDITTDGHTLPEHGFDAVLLLGLLHHIPNQQLADVLEAVRRTLRLGGYAYSLDPNRRRLVGLLKPFVRSTYDRFHSPNESELYPNEIEKLYVASGFTVVKRVWSDFCLIPMGYIFPDIPQRLIPLLSEIDSLVLRLPLIRSLSSSFAMIARVPQSQD